MINYFRRPESLLLKNEEDCIDMPKGQKYKQLIEKANIISEKKGEIPPLYHVLLQFFGGKINPYGIKFSEPCAKGGDLSERLNQPGFLVWPEDAYYEAKELAEKYNETSKNQRIEVVPLYINETGGCNVVDTLRKPPLHPEVFLNAPDGKIMIAYVINGLGKIPVFCPVNFDETFHLKPTDYQTSEGKTLEYLTQELIDSGLKQLQLEIRAVSKDYTNYENLLNYKHKGNSQKTLFEGEEFDQSTLERRLGTSLSDMGIAPGPNSKMEAFRKWVPYAMESEEGYKSIFLDMNKNDDVSCFAGSTPHTLESKRPRRN